MRCQMNVCWRLLSSLQCVSQKEIRWNFQQNAYKNFHHTLMYVAVLPCEMQAFENGTNLSLTMLKFHTRLINYWHFHIICSKYSLLTRKQACMCHSLIGRRVLSFSRTAHTEPATLSGFWSRQHWSLCHQIKQPQPQSGGGDTYYRYLRHSQ